MNKFTMGLVWHNCKTCPPTEKYNQCLYITDGTGVIPVEYKDGLFIYEDSILADGLEHVWWADLDQTARGFFAREDSKTQDLIIFCFETGDTSCPYWQVLALVDHEKMDYGTLEDSITSYMESDESEDKDFEDMVADILNESEWPWTAFTPGSKVHDVHTFWV